MQLAQQSMFHFMWPLIIVTILMVLAFQRHKKRMEIFAQRQLWDNVAQFFNPKLVKIRIGLIVATLLFSIIALSRPQWGFEWQEVKREGLDILVVVDASKSMLTQDVKPNRLERTKLAIKDLLKKLQGDRIGLVTFAGDAFLSCPLTVDYSGFVLSLNDLDINSMPRGGTNLSKALEVAMESFEELPSQYKNIIIVTDGDNLEGDPVSAARRAKEKGIKIYSIGIGTREGELIQVPTTDGGFEYLKDSKGDFVKSRLNEQLLQKISLTTGGTYVKASGAQFGLDLIYERELSRLEKREIDAKMKKRLYERFQIPLGIALLFLVIETCLWGRKK